MEVRKDLVTIIFENRFGIFAIDFRSDITMIQTIVCNTLKALFFFKSVSRSSSSGYLMIRITALTTNAATDSILRGCYAQIEINFVMKC